MKNKAAKKAVSLREKLLVGVLGVALLIGGYLMLRVKPQLVEREVMQEQLDDSRDRRKSTRAKRGGFKNIKSLEEAIAELEAEIAQQESTVSGIEGRFINLNSNQEIAQMRRSLTKLARDNRMRLSAINKSAQDLNQMTDEKQEQLADFLERPIFNLKLYGRYHDLMRFLEQLDTLPNRTVVTHLSFTKQSGFQSLNGQRDLSIDMTLSF